MKKRAFIVHGWAGYPEEGWFPWLKGKLEKRGFEVKVPKMPSPDEPKINEWVSHLSKVVGQSDKDTYFVGHSIGCQTIMRYLEQLPEESKVGGVVFVAGWVNRLDGDLSQEEKDIAKPWLETPIDLLKVAKKSPKFVAIFSDNDDWVRLAGENEKIFRDQFNAKIIVEHGKGHFSGSDNVSKLPSALDAVLSFK